MSYFDYLQFDFFFNKLYVKNCIRATLDKPTFDTFLNARLLLILFINILLIKYHLILTRNKHHYTNLYFCYKIYYNLNYKYCSIPRKNINLYIVF